MLKGQNMIQNLSTELSTGIWNYWIDNDKCNWSVIELLLLNMIYIKIWIQNIITYFESINILCNLIWKIQNQGKVVHSDESFYPISSYSVLFHLLLWSGKILSICVVTKIGTEAMAKLIINWRLSLITN